MSKFYGSDTSSSSESEIDEIDQKIVPSGPSFMVSDDEEDTKRIVRSAKEKRYEQIHTIIKSIRNSKKIGDFNKMESSFKELCNAHDKAKPVIAKEENGVTPIFYIRILVEMEDLINVTWDDTEKRKRMSKTNAKCFSALRQKLRKYIKLEFENEIAKFRENPDMLDDDDDDGDDVEEEDEKSEEETFLRKDKSSAGKKESLKKGKKSDAEDDDSDDSYWDNMSESSSDSSSDDEGQRDWRKHFLKKEVDSGKVKKDKKVRTQRVKVVKESEDEGDWTVVERTAEKPKLFEKNVDITYNVVINKLHEIIGGRGKKKTEDRVQIQLLLELLNISNEYNLGVGLGTKIQFAVVASIFDCNPQITGAMRPQIWEKCMTAVEELLNMIEENEAVMDTLEDIHEDSELLEHPPYRVRGSFLLCVEKLDEEFIKILKDADEHSYEYIEHLKVEPRILRMFEKALGIITRKNKDRLNNLLSDTCRIYIKKIEHLYFKVDQNVLNQKTGKLSENELTALHKMDKMCKYIYASEYSRLRTQAILSHIYFHAIHDNWFEARDLMLMSHLQDSINNADPSIQILYNRTMVQLGICAFRHGEINEAHNALLDFVASRRSKELLGQGLLLQRQMERSDDEEKIAKQRQLPFHMHINLELMECVYLVSAMLIEIPYMAAHEYEGRKRMISKPFFQQLRSSERQSLIGPPESMREFVIAASREMKIGDWKKCFDFIINDKMNAKVWNLFPEVKNVQQMLLRKIQEESLRTYLFAYSKVYNSISMITLSEMFPLGKESVHAIVSKMIINEEIMAKLDEPTECLVMDKTEPTRLQSTCLQLAQKLSQLCDSNQKLMELNPGAAQQNNRRGNYNQNDNRGKNNYRGSNRSFVKIH